MAVRNSRSASEVFTKDTCYPGNFSLGNRRASSTYSMCWIYIHCSRALFPMKRNGEFAGKYGRGFRGSIIACLSKTRSRNTGVELKSGQWKHLSDITCVLPELRDHRIGSERPRAAQSCTPRSPLPKWQTYHGSTRNNG